MTLTVDRDHNELSGIMRDGAVYLREAELALGTADSSLQGWANSYHEDLAFYMFLLPMGPMVELGQKETVELDRAAWAALGETIDLAANCDQ